MQYKAELRVGEYMFEEIKNFKSLSTNLNSVNDNDEEVKKNVLH